MLLELSLGFITVLLIWFLNDQIKFKAYPPGPFRFPLLGSLPHVAAYSLKAVAKTSSCVLYTLSKAYGDIVHVRMGLIDFVIFSSYDTITELLSTNGVGNRKIFNHYLDRNTLHNQGIFISNDIEWSTMRRFTIRTLRQFGFGKSASMGAVITEEANKYIDHVKSKIMSGSIKNVLHVDGDMFGMSAVNIIWRLVTGKTYEMEDERMKALLKAGNEYVESVAVDDITVCYPILRTLFPKLSGKAKQCETVGKLKKFIEEVVEEYKTNRYDGHEADCFIDLFLDEIDNKKEYFTYQQLIVTLLDMFQGGSETTSKTLTFCILHLVRNPMIQERIYQEIALSDYAPPNDFVEMKEKFPLCYSTLMEAMRFSDVVPITPPYQCYQDMTIRGYTIKAGTPLMVNLESIHWDKRIWGDPEVFRPERFLDENGKVISKMCEYVMVFSKGKRACLGQTLAESTLSIFLYNLVKTFKFSHPNGQKKLPSTLPVPGLTYGTQPFNIDITVRQ